MRDSSSYHVAEIAGDTHREILRLNAQVDLFWPQEIAQLKLSGLADGLTILDAGCGSGRYSELLLGEFPGSQVIGLEPDIHFMPALQSLVASIGGERFRHIPASVYETGMDSGSVDCVIIRLLLEHLNRPIAALSELSKVLKPGGLIVAVDNDFDLHLCTSPPIRELDDLYAAYRAARQGEGGNPCIGRQLPNLLLRSGFGQISFNALIAHNAVCGDAKFLHSEGSGIAAQLLGDGFLSKDSFDALGRNWRQLMGYADHSIMRMLFMATGVKPIEKPAEAISAAGLSGGILKADPDSVVQALQRPFREFVIEKIAELIQIDVSDLTMDTSLFKQGLDSLAAVDLQAFLETQFGISINIALLYENMPTEELIKRLEGMFGRPGEHLQPLAEDVSKRPGNEEWLEGSV